MKAMRFGILTTDMTDSTALKQVRDGALRRLGCRGFDQYCHWRDAAGAGTVFESHGISRDHGQSAFRARRCGQTRRKSAAWASEVADFLGSPVDPGEEQRSPRTRGLARIAAQSDDRARNGESCLALAFRAGDRGERG